MGQILPMGLTFNTPALGGPGQATWSQPQAALWREHYLLTELLQGPIPWKLIYNVKRYSNSLIHMGDIIHTHTPHWQFKGL